MRNPLTWRQAAWYFGGSWALLLVAYLDAHAPRHVPRDLLYLVPLGLATWRLGRQAAWLLAVNAGTARMIALGQQIGDAALAVSFEVVAGAAVLQFAAFTYGLLMLRDALARERARADEDALTGLLSRRAFDESLGRSLAARRGATGDGSGVLVYVDLDGFKAVNDTQGHEAGDAVLRLAAGVLRDCTRSGDIVARLGGDEFAIWLPGSGAEAATAVADRALRELRSRAAAGGWAVGASLGVAVFDRRPSSVAAAVRAADALMYQVKRSGKGRVVVGRVAA